VTGEVDELVAAVHEMGRAVDALRLEVPAAVADDVAVRWRRVLAGLDGVGVAR